TGGSGEPGGGPGSARRTAQGFALAAAAFSGTAAQESPLAAPGLNSLATNLDGSSQFGAPPSADQQVGAQEPQTPVVGMEERRSLSTGRVRRINPEFSGARTAANPTGRRADAGTLAGGGPGGDIPAARFRNLTQTALPQGAGASFYDAVANVFVVNLQLLGTGGGDSNVPLQPNPQNTVRFSVSDTVAPSVSRDVRNFVVRDTTNGELLRDANGQPRRFRFEASNVLADVANGQLLRDALGNPLVFDFADNGTRTSDSLRAVPVTAAHRAGSVLEVPTRPPGVRTAAPQGEVFALAGGNGLAATRGSPLPSASDPVVNTNATGGPNPGIVQTRVEPTSTSTPEFETRITTVAPGVQLVFIIDKVTEGSEAITRERGILPGERFIVAGGQPIATPADGRLPGAGPAGLTPGTVVRYAISDGLNPLGPDGQPNINRPGGWRADAGSTIAAQFLTPDAAFGRPRAFSTYNAFRPEESFVPEATRGDTHLLVVAGEGNRHPAMRLDLQVAPDGRSSAGITVGGLLVLPDGGGLALSAATVGSARLGPGGSLAVRGTTGSLATAGDAYSGHLLPNTDPSIVAAGGGAIGHFLVGETDPRLGRPNAPAVRPGSVTPVGGGGTTPYGFTRLATGVGPVDGPGRTEDGRTLQGFAAGIAEVPLGNGQLGYHAVTGDDPTAVAVTRGAGASEFVASIRTAPAAVGELASDPLAAPAGTGAATPRTLRFGGNGPTGAPTSAFASDATFAAVIPGQAAMASVDADTRAGIAGGGVMPPSNAHLAWGLFLGDLVPQADGASTREYVGMGFWVAGRLVEPSVLSTLTGTASYTGGMIGTAVGPGRVATVVGNFQQSWDFARRAGGFSAQFDGAAYTAGLAMPGGSAVFAGSGTTGDRTLAVRGGFFNAGPIANGTPGAVGGVFGIRSTGPYGANGVFVGTPRP
ncbi:hypothetical protein, partial [Plastoroseomonas arctica]